MQVFAIAALLVATTTRTASDCALSLTAAGLVAVASTSTVVDMWEKLWLFAGITVPWVYAFEIPFMSDEALFAWRAQYTALRWLVVSAAGVMGIVHGRLLSIPWKARVATGAVVTCEMWAILYMRGLASSVGVPVCAAFFSCLAMCMWIYRNEQSLALIPADTLTTHGDNRVSVEGSPVRSQPDAPRCQPAGSEASSGPFSRPRSLWSGWSAAWSDPEDATYQQKLSQMLIPHSRMRVSFDAREQVQESVRWAKAALAKQEASKAKRRAEQHGKARAPLVWRLLRHGTSPLARLPKDALRIIINEWAAAETARLERLYAHRLAEGATSYRG